jgi:G3E family GTPase
MAKVNIISGFLGAGKTTLIKKLISEVFKGEKLILIENEFGEIGVDGAFLQDAGIEIKEMNQGCICCSLVGDFAEALKEVETKYSPDRIIIEPSGVGKLSDVIAAVNGAGDDRIFVDSCITVADASKCKMYRKNFGEFYEDQISFSSCILLTRTDKLTTEKIEAAVEILRDINSDAAIITTPLALLSAEQLLDAFDKGHLEEEMLEEALKEHEEHEHEHHHDHDHEEHEHEHHHHYDENGECSCGHHHHHHADEAFTSWGFETPATYEKDEIEKILTALDGGEYGAILIAKGMVASASGEWVYFDYVPEEHDIRDGAPCYTGKVCVIGAELKEDKLSELFKK